MKKALVVPTALVLILSLTTCKKKLIPGIYEGVPVPMGNGTISCWSAFDSEGKPTAIGMTLTDGALDNLPDSGSHASGNDHSNVFEAQLPPEIVSKTPFQHIAANWNPKGHTQGIYDKPHFDFHFYMISSAERKAIPDYSVDSAGFKKDPPQGYLPPNFISPPGGSEPQMGKHWIDSNAPELPWHQPAPESFEETWVYGTYNGAVTFYEPMITHVFLTTKGSLNKTIPRPAKVQKSGYYPTILHVKHEDGKYYICLETFEYRKGE
jgi:hypothetical protein